MDTKVNFHDLGSMDRKAFGALSSTEWQLAANFSLH